MFLQSFYQKYDWSSIETKIMEMAHRGCSKSVFDYEHSMGGKKHSHDLSECLDFLQQNKIVYNLSQRCQKGVDGLIVKTINIKFPEILDQTIFIHHIYLQNQNFLVRNNYSKLAKKLLELNFELQRATNNGEITLDLDISKTNLNDGGDFDMDINLKNQLIKILDQHLLNYNIKTKGGLMMSYYLEISGWMTK